MTRAAERNRTATQRPRQRRAWAYSGLAAACLALVWLLPWGGLALPIGTAPAHAAAPAEPTGSERWHTFTSENGLAGNIVQAIWEDPSGAIWFGTENGVSRYDGTTWQTYRMADGLIDNNVWAISGDDETVWFATSSGVSVLRTGVGVWNSYVAQDGLPDNDVRSVLVGSDGTVWVGTFGNGIGRKPANTQRWERVDISTQIRTSNVVVHTIWQDRAARLWFGTTAFGALRYDGAGWERFSFRKTGLNTIWSIGSGRSPGTISLATFRGIVHVARDDTVDVVEERINGIEIGDTEVLAVAGGPTTGLWFGTRADGVFRLDQGEWRHYTTDDGLARNYVQRILEDRSGRIWLGTRGGGVSLLDSQPLKPYTLRAEITGQDVRHDMAVLGSELPLRHDQNNLQFTFTMTAPWLPPHDVTFNYWLEREDRVSTPSQPERHMVRSDPAPAIIARSDVFIDLEPGSYRLHVAPAIGTMRGTQTLYRFTISSAPPSLGADTIDITVGRQQVERGLTLPQSLFASTRQVRLVFAADDDVTAPDELHYRYRVDTITSTWQLADGAQALITLPQGQHQIEVLAIDADENRSAPTHITAIVPAPLWETILAALLLILVPSSISSIIGARSYQLWARYQALRRAVSGYVIPYDVGPLITVPDRYIGRQHILDTILGKLDNNSFYISGEKRIGKTSLLLQLKQRLLQRNTLQPHTTYVPVFRNMQDLPQEQFWLYLVRSIAAEMPHLPDAQALAADSNSASYDDFDAESDIETLLAGLRTTMAQAEGAATSAHHLSIVLLLDEVDTLQRYDPSIRQRFRAFCQHMQRNVRVVLAGVQPPYAEPTENSPWYNIFEPLTLGPLAREDTLFLIRNYNHNPYPYAPDAEQAILDGASGKPFLTQWICSEAVKAMLAARRTRVRLQDVEQALETIASEYERMSSLDA